MPKSSAKRCRILVADESISIQKSVNLAFAGQTEFEVIGSADGQDAWVKVKTLKPEFVLADCQLRQISGFQLCEKIRGDSSLAKTFVILLKSANLEGAEAMAQDCHADD